MQTTYSAVSLSMYVISDVASAKNTNTNMAYMCSVHIWKVLVSHFATVFLASFHLISQNSINYISDVHTFVGWNFHLCSSLVFNCFRHRLQFRLSIWGVWSLVCLVIANTLLTAAITATSHTLCVHIEYRTSHRDDTKINGNSVVNLLLYNSLANGIFLLELGSFCVPLPFAIIFRLAIYQFVCVSVSLTQLYC